MNDRTKEIIIKTLIVLGAVFGVLLILIPLISAICRGDAVEITNAEQSPLPSPFYGIWIIDMIAFFVSGVALMIVLPIFGLKQKPVKAEKMPLSFADFTTLANHIDGSAKSKNYVQQPTRAFAKDGMLITYIKPNRARELGCIALVRVAEISDEILDAADDAITESLKAYCGKDIITDTVNIITIVCVDRITPAFQKMVNTNIQQGFKNGRLPVGISFGGKTVYIAKQKDGFATAKYKKLRKEFLRIMQTGSEATTERKGKQYADS